MARGTVVGESVVSQAATDEYREAHERIFGNKPVQRGRFIYDPRVGKCVPAEEYVPPEEARSAPIMCDRFMEGQTTADGIDIGSRAKRRAYMAAHGVADYDDYKGVRAKKAAEREAKRRGEFKPDKQLRETIGRALYKQKIIL